MRKILSIDGGGIKGVFPAALLATIEEQLAQPIGSYFDLIVGTSTGGIIALGLGAGMRAEKVLGFYEAHGPTIFARPGMFALLKSLVSGKYGAEGLREALDETFGAKLIGESTTRLVVPSQDLETGEVHIFKTSHDPRFTIDYKIPMVHAALATSAAPSYFPTHKLPVGTPLIDGGIWANNPAGVAAVEAIGILGWRKGDILMLSLSCTRSPLDASWAVSYSHGKAYWGMKLVDVLGTGQSSGSMGMAKNLLGRENVFRIEPTVGAGRFALDKYARIESLKGLGASEARKALPQLTRFFEAPAERFVPCHSL